MLIVVMVPIVADFLAFGLCFEVEFIAIWADGFTFAIDFLESGPTDAFFGV